MSVPVVEGKLNFLGGCALESKDGYTYLNAVAREAIKEAARTIREQEEEIESLRRKIITGNG